MADPTEADPSPSELPDDLYKTIDGMTPEELDALPFGTVHLDLTGCITEYNAYESDLARVARDRAVGRNFFTEVAPCTNVREFHGRFLEGVAEKRLHAKFRYHFSFEHKPMDVVVTLHYSVLTDSVWLLVQPVK